MKFYPHVFANLHTLIKELNFQLLINEKLKKTVQDLIIRSETFYSEKGLSRICRIVGSKPGKTYRFNHLYRNRKK